MRQVRGSSLRARIFGIVGLVIPMVAAVSGACLFKSQTTLCETSGLLCPPGWTCAAAQDICIPSGGCGDGIVSPDEVCDDGNVLPEDSCSPDCQSDKPCGDGVVDPAEACDTGVADSPTCNSDCTAVRCGDNHPNLAAGEECDNGGMDTADCNGRICAVPRCGDKYYNPEFTLPGTNQKEQCDSGGVDTPACDSDCTVPLCGDNHYNPQYAIPGQNRKEQCDPGILMNGMPQDSMSCDFDCTNVVCGDDHINMEAGEECEDDNTETRDACPRGNGSGGTCKKAKCGDGYVWDLAGGSEQCDDGANGVPKDSPDCDRDCTNSECGDKYRNAVAGEECDDDNDIENDACPKGNSPGGCKNARCGDGYIYTSIHGGEEVCDYGADAANDGCGASEKCAMDCKSCVAGA